jgi:flavodoxin
MMKKWTARLLSMLMVFVLSACGNTSKEDGTAAGGGAEDQKESEVTPPLETESTEGNRTENPESTEGKTLVVYFSMPETTNPDNMTQEEDNSVVVIDGEVLGNTQYVAYVIQENTGADIFRIEPETPYPTDHKTLVDLAAQEQDDDARPAIKDNIKNLEQYDTVFVGYPNWWGDMPMILYSFFDTYDFSGKNIIPFNTHGGSGFSNTISTIEKLEPDANVNKDGFTVSRNRVQDAEPDIIAWLGDLGYKETETTTNTGNKALVVYYSATGNTGEVANYIAAAMGADLFELEPTQNYSSADLDWTDSDSRVSREHDHLEDRVVPLVADTVKNWDSYDTVFIGYPIWWGIAAWPVDGFITANDFTGKTVIPFCTSSSSGLGESGDLLKEAARTGEWLEGTRFRSGASKETVEEWVKSLGL